MRSVVTCAVAVSFAVVAMACGGGSDAGPQRVELRFDFNNGDAGWVAGFSDYGPEFEMELDSGVAPLPDSLDARGTGYRVTGMNRTDDLFMFLKRGIGADEGVEAGQAYRVRYRIVFASDAPTGCMGIGGAPGESVYLKAGVVSEEPEAVFVDGYFEFTADKSNQSSGGQDVWLVGDIANGIECDEALAGGQPFAFVERAYEHSVPVEAGDGGMWLIVGTDSGFEGRTTLYYTEIELTLEPVDP
jgi:hypothetical protein